MNIYGKKLSSDELAERNTLDRQIVSEIMNVGVSDDQIWHIVYLLSLELSDVEGMKALSAFVRGRTQQNIFLSPKDEE